MRAYVQSRVPRWVPFIWLAYLTFFLWQPITQHASRAEWIATAAALIVFLFFYFAFFVTKRPWPLVCVVCIGAIGVVYAPFNGGAANFFIYAASMAPFALDTEWAGALAIAGVGVRILENPDDEWADRWHDISFQVAEPFRWVTGTVARKQYARHA